MRGWLTFLGWVFGLATALLVEWVWWKFRPRKGPVVRISITKEWDMLTKGKAAAFKATAFNAEGDIVPFPADTSATATNGAPSFDPATGLGSVTPTSAGDETITVSAGGVSGTVSDTVQADPTIASIKVELV